jgi:hypothetical protein
MIAKFIWWKHEHQDVELGLQLSPKHLTSNLGQNFILKPSIDLKSLTRGHKSIKNIWSNVKGNNTVLVGLFFNKIII